MYRILRCVDNPHLLLLKPPLFWGGLSYSFASDSCRMAAVASLTWQRTGQGRTDGTLITGGVINWTWGLTDSKQGNLEKTHAHTMSWYYLIIVSPALQDVFDVCWINPKMWFFKNSGSKINFAIFGLRFPNPGQRTRFQIGFCT